MGVSLGEIGHYTGAGRTCIVAKLDYDCMNTNIFIFTTEYPTYICDFERGPLLL